MARRKLEAPFKFQPFSNKQLKVLTWYMDSSPYSNYNGIICDGSIRSGKTLCMSFSFVVWAMETFNEKNFIMAGKSVGSFRRNVVSTLKLMLICRGYTIKDSKSDNMITISKGGVINYFYIFGGLNEKSQDLVQGLTSAGVYLDEVSLMPQSFVDQCIGRCSVKGSKYWFNCNPDSPYSFVKTKWIDKADEKKVLHLHFTMDDNLTLDKEIKLRYESMFSGVFYDRYILGKWCMAEGIIYDNFDPKRHVINDISDVDLSKCYVSCDYGVMNPMVYLLWAKNSKGKWICVKEYYYSGRDKQKQKTDYEYADDLKGFLDGVIPMAIIVDPSASSFIAELRKRGYNVKKAKNDVIDGIRLVSELLNNEEILFHSSCKNGFEEFGSYSWDDKSVEDRPIKEHDHFCDAVRYFCYTILNKSNKIKVGSKAKLGLR